MCSQKKQKNDSEVKGRGRDKEFKLSICKEEKEMQKEGDENRECSITQSVAGCMKGGLFHLHFVSFSLVHTIYLFFPAKHFMKLLAKLWVTNKKKLSDICFYFFVSKSVKLDGLQTFLSL